MVQEIMLGPWHDHHCSECKCFCCVALHWLKTLKCTCAPNQKLTHAHTLDDCVWSRRWRCRFILDIERSPPSMWCLCIPHPHFEPPRGRDISEDIDIVYDKGVKQGLVIHYKSSATLEEDWLGSKQPSKLLIGMYGIDTMEVDIYNM